MLCPYGMWLVGGRLGKASHLCFSPIALFAIFAFPLDFIEHISYNLIVGNLNLNNPIINNPAIGKF